MKYDLRARNTKLPIANSVCVIVSESRALYELAGGYGPGTDTGEAPTVGGLPGTRQRPAAADRTGPQGQCRQEEGAQLEVYTEIQ